jgi:uncharacterized membrane protein YphA (DoxX/SURF4 family)
MKTELTFSEKIDTWAEQKKMYPIDAIRILFGIFLIWKGYQFGEKPETIPVVMGRFSFIEVFLIVYLVIVQIAAGILIMVGLITRTAIICMLPIMIGAAVYSSRATTVLPYTGTTWAFICLLLSMAYLAYGSGVFSCDLYFRKHPPISHI